MSDFKLIDELLQHHLEAWDDEYWQRRDKVERKNIGRSTDDGLVLRAAFAAGWFGDKHKTDISPDERVANMTGGEVAELATAVNAAWRVARATDPKLIYKSVITSLGMGDHLAFLQKLGALKPGEMVAIKAGTNGKLAILRDTTTPSTRTTPVKDTKAPQVVPSNGQKDTLNSGKLRVES